MINAILPESYIRPHKHEDPDKVELFSILKGKVACLHFQPDGEIQQLYILEQNGVNQIADIAPGTYHTLLALEPSVVLEILQGPYEAETHKQFASWAPEEGSTKAQDYVMYLRALIENWR
jgi:cupin fold WbuC family metalloprotein